MTKRYLYIDTNVYLTFYHFSNEDLQELKKLIALIKSGNIVLYLPEQTKNEFDRNREVKIHDSFERFRNSKLNNEFPIMCRSYPEFEAMQKAIKQFDLNKSKLFNKLQHDAESETLAADEVLNQLFSEAKELPNKDDIIELAIRRFNIGNPPGKDKSYGDAINWECLLRNAETYEDLYFISDDKDFYSKLNSKNFNSYLLKEWESEKKSDIYHFRRLSDFFKAYYPNIELSSETEKDIAINNLFEANTFDSAIAAVRNLRKYENFSVKQLDDITEAFSSNNQIYWIKNNYQINRARLEIIEENEFNIDTSLLAKFRKIFNQ